MPYIRSDNRTARTRFVDLLVPSQDLTPDAAGFPAASSSGVVSGGVTKAGLELGDVGVLRLVFNCTVAGTTLTPIIETSFDNAVADAYRACPTAGAFAAVTATGITRATYFPDRWVRVRWAAPTGSFTFTLSGEGLTSGP